MPHKKPPGYEPPLKVLEHTPDITETEVMFTKKRGPWSQLKDISIVRKRHSAQCVLKELEDKLYHTHIKTINSKRIALPSIVDLEKYLERAYTKKNWGAEGIFIIDTYTGKNIGRTFYMFTNKTKEIIDKLYEKYKNTISDGYIQNGWCGNNPIRLSILKKNYHNLYNAIKRSILFTRLLNKELEFVVSPNDYENILEKEFGIKIRFVAMPGYKFNKEKMIFEKIK